MASERAAAQFGLHIVAHAVQDQASNRTRLAAGYAYKLYRTNVNGNEIIKVLVGPYSGEQLKSELAKIKQSAAPTED